MNKNHKVEKDGTGIAWLADHSIFDHFEPLLARFPLMSYSDHCNKVMIRRF